MKRFLLFSFLFVLVVSACKREFPAPRNVLLITMDTTRADYFHDLVGKRRDSIPRLASLLRDGAVFQQAVTSINSTNPAHLSILTSQYPAQLGVHTNSERYEGKYETLAEILSHNGFRTAAAVSAFHLGNPKFDLLRGFQEKAVPRGAFTATEMTDNALLWLSRAGSEPFFLWLHYFDPHAIYDPPGEFVPPADLLPVPDQQRLPEDGTIRILDRDPFFSRSGFGSLWENWIGKETELPNVKRLYMGEIQYMCTEINRFLVHFLDSAYGNNTLIVLVADHGESLGEHGIYFDHMGLHDPQALVPLVIYFPPRIQPGTNISRQIRTVDILPTVLDFMKIEKSSDLAGGSLITDLTQPGGASSDVPAIVENTGLTQVGVRSGRWKLILPVRPDRVLANDIELFDLKSDPLETRSVLKQHPAEAEKLKKLLQDYVAGSKQGSRPALSPEEIETLRSLGYVD